MHETYCDKENDSGVEYIGEFNCVKNGNLKDFGKANEIWLSIVIKCFYKFNCRLNLNKSCIDLFKNPVSYSVDSPKIIVLIPTSACININVCPYFIVLK